MHVKNNPSKLQEDAAKSKGVRECEGSGERDGEETEATERDETEREEGHIEVRKMFLRKRSRSNYATEWRKGPRPFCCGFARDD